ncbi:MAG: TonB-dependent receptor plug domain-containing protein [Spirochaetes bacterium]|nr:TonB-dependent receptor plug domain-containing protein [Spirochaetota bacterium]
MVISRYIPTTRAKARVLFVAACAAISIVVSPPLFAQKPGPSDVAGKDQADENKEEKKADEAPDAEKQEEKGPGEKTSKQHGVFTIGEIVVRGESIAHIDRAATTTELKAKDLKARGNRTLDEALVTVPGVQVEGHTKGHMRVKMRGFDQDKIAILVDGVPIADVFSTDIDISDLTVKNISRIYVNRGVSSALYGTGGAIGAINIVSRKPRKLFAQGGGEYGLYNNYIFDAAVGGPYKNFYGWITGSVQNSDGYHPSKSLTRSKRLDWFNKLVRYYVFGADPSTMNVPGPWQYLFDSGRWNHSDYRKYNTSARVGYELGDRLDVGIAARFSYGSGNTNTYQNRCYGDYKINNLWWREPIFNFTLPKDLKKAALANRSFAWPEKYAFSVSPYLKFKHKIFTLKLQGFYSQTYAKEEGYLDQLHIYAKDPPAVLSKDASYYEPVYDYKTYVSYGVQAYPSVKIASWNRLSMAVLWRTDEIDARQKAVSPLLCQEVVTYYGTSKYKVDYLKAHFLTVALEDEISVMDRLRITAGVSYDAQDFTTHKSRNDEYRYIFYDAYRVKDNVTIWGTRDSFNPVAGLVFDAVKDLLTLRSAFSMKTRFPTLGEYEKVSYVLYDRGLKSERSHNFNAGPQFHLLDGSLEIGADYFFSIVKNRIEKIAGSEEPPVNISRIDSHGMETAVSYRKKDVGGVVDIEASLAYTFLHARNRDTSWEEAVNKGKYMENTPAHQVIADVRFAFKTGTAIGIWGTALIDQIMYAQQVRPPADTSSFAAYYSRRFFTAVRLHDQFSLNARVSQEIWKHFTLYVLFKNILDDYNPDPFNPGPGFMFYGGFEAKL